MTKEDFKRKYHDKVIEIPYLPSMRSERELMGTINQVANCCAEMGLKTNLLPETAFFGMPKKLMVVTDPALSPTGSTEQNVFNFEELLADFKSYTEAQEEGKYDKAKKLLADFKIEYGSITKKHKSCTSTDMVDEGFIQGYTSNEASLWWHPMGRRVFFVRGEGAFELTDKVEENA